MCKVVEGSDDEVTLWKLTENALRTELSAEERRAVIRQTYEVVARMRAAQKAAEPPPTPAGTLPKRGPGRPKRADRAERDQVAKALGIDHSTVDAALAPPKPTEAPGRPYALPSYGMEIDAAWLATVEKYDTALQGARQMVILTTAGLTKLEEAIEEGTASGPTARVARLRDEARALGQRLYGALPARLCPYCKGGSDPCAACGGSAVTVRDQEGQAPKELLAEAPLMVARGGEFVPMDAPLAEQTDGQERMPWE
jgi:hypothetical protein